MTEISNDQSPKSETDNSKKTVLVVDDEASILKLTEIFLTRNGFNVITARDGEEALATFLNPENSTIDLIITDNNMPRMSGVELIQRVRETNSRIPIFLASGDFFGGLSEKETQSKAEEVGATVGIAKPFDIKEVVNLSKQLLEKAENRTS